MNRSDEIASALESIHAELPERCTLIVVTKTFPVTDVEILYRLGQRDFGENRDEEGASKSIALPDDVRWHFQGQIQSKKIKSIASWADYIHSLDDLGHASKLDSAARDLNKTLKAFIQINLDSDVNRAQRGGVDPVKLDHFLDELGKLRAEGPKGISIFGVMGIAPLHEDPAPAFAQLQQFSEQVQKSFPEARAISAGMSGDYKIALNYGATHIRLGSSILGHR